MQKLSNLISNLTLDLNGRQNFKFFAPPKFSKFFISFENFLNPKFPRCAEATVVVVPAVVLNPELTWKVSDLSLSFGTLTLDLVTYGGNLD